MLIQFIICPKQEQELVEGGPFAATSSQRRQTDAAGSRGGVLSEENQHTVRQEGHRWLFLFTSAPNHSSLDDPESFHPAKSEKQPEERPRGHVQRPFRSLRERQKHGSCG